MSDDNSYPADAELARRINCCAARRLQRGHANHQLGHLGSQSRGRHLRPRDRSSLNRGPAIATEGAD
jgi:hypothetical protein